MNAAGSADFNPRAFTPARSLFREQPVLSIGRDTPLLASRAAVLSLLRREIISADPDEAACLLQSARPFSLVILGHTLTDGEICSVSSLARNRRPAPPLLMMYVHPRSGTIETLVDASVQTLEGPAELVRRSSRLLGLDFASLDSEGLDSSGRAARHPVSEASKW